MRGDRDIRQMVLIGVIVSAIGIAVSLSIHWFPSQAASEAHDIDTLYDVLLIFSVPIFVLVETVVLFSVWKFRARPGDELRDGPPIHGNTRLEIVWTAIPAILLVTLCSYAYVVLHKIEKPRKGALVVDVTAQQFAWQFTYPQPGGRKVVTDQLYVPTGRQVSFRVRSLDVIHSFWVPDFRLKTDAVPGITTGIRVTPTRPGVYPVVCAELCGLGHSTMRSTAHVLTPAAFAAWMRRELARAGGGAAKGAGAGAAKGGAGAAKGAGGGAAGAGALAAAGKQVFSSPDTGCGACHTLADAGTTGTTGPDLGKVLRGKPPAFIRQSIVSPNAVIASGYPANVMPQNFAQVLSAKQIESLVAYLTKVTR